MKVLKKCLLNYNSDLDKNNLAYFFSTALNPKN